MVAIVSETREHLEITPHRTRRNLGPNKSGSDFGSSTSDLRLGGKWLMRGTDPSKAGKGVAFLTAVKGADVRKTAKAEGLAPAEK